MKNNDYELKFLAFVFAALVLMVAYQWRYFNFLDNKIQAEVDRANLSISKSTALYIETFNEKNKLEEKVEELESRLAVTVLPSPLPPWWVEEPEGTSLLNRAFTIDPKKPNFPREKNE